MRAPLVQAKQDDGAIRIHYLTKVVMAGRCLGLAEERLVPLEAAELPGTSFTPMIVQVRLIAFPLLA